MAARALHDGKADGVRVRDRVRRQTFEPAPRCGVIVSRRKVQRHALAGIQALEGAERGLKTGAEKGQAMCLGDDEIRGEQRNTAGERLTEKPVGFGVMLVAPAPQRDPGAAIDEQPSGSGGGARGTGLESRQRTSRRGNARSVRSDRREGRRCRR